MTLLQHIKRIRCWWRYAHRESPSFGWFRYDVPGICSDCGKVGDGIQRNDQ